MRTRALMKKAALLAAAGALYHKAIRPREPSARLMRGRRRGTLSSVATARSLVR
jgi:hypothetical protein